ncbi:MAG: acyl-CoA dehydrogenase family protein, partial [Rhodospirillales bacterium]
MTEITENELRSQVREYLEANWDPNRGLAEWREMLAESGWGMPHWPKDWLGRGLPLGMTAIVDEEFNKFGAVGAAKMGIRVLAAATILEHGTDLQKEKYLKGIMTGTETWCQLFSEPGSGSDLAGAATRADFKDGKWIINGQKVWTTSAHHADYALLLARTDWDAVKHKGLRGVLVDMGVAGVGGLRGRRGWG